MSIDWVRGFVDLKFETCFVNQISIHLNELAQVSPIQNLVE